MTLPDGCFLCGAPWEGKVGTTNPSSGRLWIRTPADVRRVVSTPPGQDLPLVMRTDRHILFEIPSAFVRSDSADDTETVRLRLTMTDGTQREASIRRTTALRWRRLGKDDDTEPDSAPKASDASDEALCLVDRHVAAMAATYDTPTETGSRWTGIAEGLAVRPWASLRDIYCSLGSRDDATLALIVRIAERAQGLIDDVCRRPRRILRRKRQLERIDRVQGIDDSCLRWLVRRPGSSVAEKAGPRQKVLAVVRDESVDTHENRVVRDFLRLVGRASDAYLFENRLRKNAERVRLVRRFRRRVRRLLATSEIGQVSSLVGSPRPNYVLLHDDRYRRLWHWYELLRRQQREQDEAWRWRERTWSEIANISVCVALDALERAHGLASHGLGSEVLIRSEHAAGHYLDTRSDFGPWALRSQGAARWTFFVSQAQLAAARVPLELPQDIIELAPDGLVVVQRPGRPVFCAIWARFLRPHDFRETVASLDDSLARRATRILAGLVLVPQLEAPRDAAHQGPIRAGLATGLITSPNVVEAASSLTEALGVALT